MKLDDFQTSEPETEAARNLWQRLSLAGNNHLTQIVERLKEIGPSPGSLVLVQARQIHDADSDMDSAVLCGMDVYTHLQIGRAYFVPSLAATIDFVEFILRSYPFPVQEIRTSDHKNDAAREIEHRFALAAHRCGVRHSICDFRSAEAESFLEPYFFKSDGVNLGPAEAVRGESLARELQDFLFFHNHHRSLPSLGGKTPFEKLRMIDDYRNLTEFNPR